MKYFFFGIWAVLGCLFGFAATYVCGWKNGTDGLECGIPVLVFFLGLGFVHWRKLRRYG
ncbi:hypothetical protein MGWOODY_Hyp814 [hydrothermal vent metagenome]|uniref:Uncharacterized protein n=1 Tax=hydrothermal vent metagenome TaxID=652676 RepID=A0A160U130_9ZZZZ